MKYRLLALDLDGTLLNSQKEITPEVRKALAWAKERGVCRSLDRTHCRRSGGVRP